MSSYSVQPFLRLRVSTNSVGTPRPIPRRRRRVRLDVIQLEDRLTPCTVPPTTPCPPAHCGDVAGQGPSTQIDLSLTKTVDNPTPEVGQNITYTISVTNSGPGIANGVTARDILPTGLSFVSANAGFG